MLSDDPTALIGLPLIRLTAMLASGGLRCCRRLSRGGTLYLLPCPIADGSVDAVMPAGVIAIARGLTYFLAENAKSARAFLKAIGHPRPLRDLQIVEIGHAPPVE